MNNTIYTLGYSGWKIEDVEAVVTKLDAILVDVRMVPRSRSAVWNGGTLRNRLGDRYVWLKQFGNRNYKGTVDQIEIADFPAGEECLRKLIINGTPLGAIAGKAVILLCGCPNVAACHRKILAEWLAQAWQAEIVHLTRLDNGIRSGQPTLF
jgi:uncharacterized protein (DUF488 family)